MKSLMSFFKVLLHECGSRCGIDTSADYKTVSVRTEHEGLSFLTISLSNFRAHFEQSLGAERWQPGLTAFAEKSGLPIFLGGFLLLVFNTDGTLRDNPSIEAIRCIRQITGIANKIELPTSESRNKAAIEKYVACETELGTWEDNSFPRLDLTNFDRVVSVLYGQMFANLDLLVYNGELLPSHGPGATADSLKGNAKWMQNRWPIRLEEYFPCGEFLFPNHGWYRELQEIQFVEPRDELPVKVILVPKTLKTPRVIAIEPTAMQYAQQSLLAAFVKEVEGSPLLRRLLSFLDQTPNQRFAKEGSITGELATLDLSEASDRVSNVLVKRMLKQYPHLAGAVAASRSTSAKLPSGEIINDLRKFASMGSALCFPIESLIFIAILVTAVMSAQGTTNPRGTIKSLDGRARTFGDDIICPAVYAPAVIDHLEAFGLKVNHSKSFWTGKFRESCGKDYFDGHDVSYIKLKRVFPDDRTDTEELSSIVSLRNRLFQAGYSDTVEFLDQQIKRVIPFPEGPAHSPGLVAQTHMPVKAQRICDNLQVPLIWAATVKSKIPVSRLGGHGALMKHFLKEGDNPFQDSQHLERAGRAVSQKIVMRWIPSSGV